MVVGRFLPKLPPVLESVLVTKLYGISAPTALSQFKCLGAVMDFDQMDDKMIEIDDASCLLLCNAYSMNSE